QPHKLPLLRTQHPQDRLDHLDILTRPAGSHLKGFKPYHAVACRVGYDSLRPPSVLLRPLAHPVQDVLPLALVILDRRFVDWVVIQLPLHIAKYMRRDVVLHIDPQLLLRPCRRHTYHPATAACQTPTTAPSATRRHPHLAPSVASCDTLPCLADDDFDPRPLAVHTDYRRQNRHYSAMVIRKSLTFEAVHHRFETGNHVVWVSAPMRGVVHPILHRRPDEAGSAGLHLHQPRLLCPPVPQPLTLCPMQPLLHIERDRRRAVNDEHALLSHHRPTPAWSYSSANICFQRLTASAATGWYALALGLPRMPAGSARARE